MTKTKQVVSLWQQTRRFVCFSTNCTKRLDYTDSLNAAQTEVISERQLYPKTTHFLLGPCAYYFGIELPTLFAFLLYFITYSTSRVTHSLFTLYIHTVHTASLKL